MRAASAKYASYLSLMLLFIGPGQARAENDWYDFRGEVSGWYIFSRDGSENYCYMGARYMPRLTLTHELESGNLLDFDISLNAYISASSCEYEEDNELELYRLNGRYATDLTETRLGLQKIAFGPAYVLRALMWFDNVDPRDPLGLTDGVYALRFIYTGLNNARYWAWVLYGNEDPMGYDYLPTASKVPEFGGRLHYPMLAGELAATFHYREVDAPDPLDNFREYRYALDGRWDFAIGLWFESVVQQQRSGQLPYQWTKIATLGGDYTFGIGNGLYFLIEHMALALSEKAAGWDEDRQVSACMMNYPMGISDNLQMIASYLWEDSQFRIFGAWQRTWDDWMLNIAAFHYPPSSDDGDALQQTVTGAGYGGRIIISLNH